MTDSDQEWYEKWFNEDYLKLYQKRNNKDAKQQIKLVLNTIKPDKNNTILDLACGEGRHLSILNKLGYKTFGLDLSKKLINSGRKKHGQQNFIIGDIRNIPGRFDIILSLFSSFGYFETDEENFSVFNSVFNTLKPRGRFWFDFFNSEYIKNNIEGISKKNITEDTSTIEERKIQDKRVIKKITFTSNNKKNIYYESVRLFERAELEIALKTSGFTINKIYGDYYGSDWTKNSERTIFYCTKK